MLLFYLLCSIIFSIQPEETSKLPISLEVSAYKIGAGDVLSIDVLGEKDLSGDYKVQEDGTIRFPLLGSIKMAGFTPTEASEYLEKLLEKDYFVDAQLQVKVKEYLSQKVNVLGAVRKPGVYYLKGNSTLLDILTQAGGLTENASKTILIQRESGKSKAITKIDTLVVNLEELQKGVSLHGDIQLKNGDKIFVKEMEFFYIQGEVAHPGKYEVTDDLTVIKAISLAGGFGKFANRKKVEIHRKQDGQEFVIEVNIKDVLKNKISDVTIQPSDVIVVKSRRFL